MALTGLAIAAALALAKDQFIDQPAAKRKRKLAAETERNSPWTGQHAGPVDDPNTIGTMMQYGATGAQIGAGMEQSAADANMKNAMAERLNSGGGLNATASGWGGASGKAVGDNALGGQDMGAALGAQGKAFEASQPAWFYGNNPRGVAQPVNSSIAQDASNPYGSLMDAGISPDAQQFWKTNRYAY